MRCKPILPDQLTLCEVIGFYIKCSIGKENWLREFVKNGPVSKAVLYDVNRKNNIFTIKEKLKQIDFDFSDFKSNYIKNYSEPMVSSIIIY